MFYGIDVTGSTPSFYIIESTHPERMTKRSLCFNPRVPTKSEARPEFYNSFSSSESFQSTRPDEVGSATTKAGNKRNPNRRFNPRVPTKSGARHSTRINIFCSHGFQSTRPDEVGSATLNTDKYFLFPWVSIHAPARGATFSVRSMCMRLKFQSTRPHGARRGAGIFSRR